MISSWNDAKDNVISLKLKQLKRSDSSHQPQTRGIFSLATLLYLAQFQFVFLFFFKPDWDKLKNEKIWLQILLPSTIIAGVGNIIEINHECYALRLTWKHNSVWLSFMWLLTPPVSLISVPQHFPSITSFDISTILYLLKVMCVIC